MVKQATNCGTLTLEMQTIKLTNRSLMITRSMQRADALRVVSRGAKPEFTGLVRLNVESKELENRKIRFSENLYTDDHKYVPLDCLLAAADSWDSAQEELLEHLGKDEKASRVSFGASSTAAWCAAADYLQAHPEYLRAAA